MSRAKRLTQYLQERAKLFDWGASNCCHLPAAWWEAETGQNPMNGLPRTPNQRAARRLIQILGGTLREAWTNQLGQQPVDPRLAQVGDVVYLKGDGFEAVGICVGRAAAFVSDAGTLLQIGMDQAECAWRLP